MIGHRNSVLIIRMKSIILFVGMSFIFKGAVAQGQFNIWNSKGQLDKEANCMASAMVYLQRFNSLPAAHTTSFRSAQKAYGPWLTSYTQHGEVCEREVKSSALKDQQSCIIRRMGNGRDYQFSYEVTRLWRGYSELLRSGRLSTKDLEMQLIACVNPSSLVK